MPDAAPLRVIAAAIVRRGSVLLVSKQAAPDVFYLPGGKPDDGEEALATLGRELHEELGVTLVDSTPLTVVFDRAALEPVAMEMHVYLAEVDGPGRGSRRDRGPRLGRRGRAVSRRARPGRSSGNCCRCSPSAD